MDKGSGSVIFPDTGDPKDRIRNTWWPYFMQRRVCGYYEQTWRRGTLCLDVYSVGGFNESIQFRHIDSKYRITLLNRNSQRSQIIAELNDVYFSIIVQRSRHYCWFK